MQKDIKTFQRNELGNEVCVIVGTRPGIVMLAPVIHALKARGLPFFVLHTGQHYSPNMDAQFFEDLNLPQPEHRIEGVADHKTHATQTAAMMVGIEDVLMKRRPRLVLVNGDANTNLAGALAARKLQMIVAHVESGQRSYDWRMPEEHNRVIMDHISDLVFASDDTAVEILKGENVKGKIVNVGNPIVDASLQNVKIAKEESQILSRLGLSPQSYAVMTAHREENVDNETALRNILQGVSDAATALNLPVIFPAHPRTEKRLKEFGLYDWACALPGLHLEAALGYLDFTALLAAARLVFTDSGGVQQEACIHRIPCVTTRNTTEWTDTLKIGANRLAGHDPAAIVAKAREAVESPTDWHIPFGDGTTAEKIVDEIALALVNPPRIGIQPDDMTQAA